MDRRGALRSAFLLYKTSLSELFWCPATVAVAGVLFGR